jgi:hypothetical protein
VGDRDLVASLPNLERVAFRSGLVLDQVVGRALEEKLGGFKSFGLVKVVMHKQISLGIGGMSEFGVVGIEVVRFDSGLDWSVEEGGVVREHAVAELVGAHQHGVGGLQQGLLFNGRFCYFLVIFMHIHIIISLNVWIGAYCDVILNYFIVNQGFNFGPLNKMEAILYALDRLGLSIVGVGV